MEMHITPDWLRKKIEDSPDGEIEAGFDISGLRNVYMFLPGVLVDDEHVTRLKHAFGIFIKNLRLTKELSVDDLAEAASIDNDELRLIENDPHYETKPRTVFQLSRFFKIQTQKMMVISGIAQSLDRKLEEQTLKFAAKSDGVSSLNSEEQQVLNEYVKYLNER
ncbi:hypothetical protein MNBD_GAMMA12-1354 [hydrothermal vent metagenome]|uniref:HTH cro/C1-type domain-containing protein n=1 Tax=hydrothermal vent metagenome TaxID=652676 RepID=A0A3B0YI33_9ZZZZ